MKKKTKKDLGIYSSYQVHTYDCVIEVGKGHIGIWEEDDDLEAGEVTRKSLGNSVCFTSYTARQMAYLFEEMADRLEIDEKERSKKTTEKRKTVKKKTVKKKTTGLKKDGTPKEKPGPKPEKG